MTDRGGSQVNDILRIMSPMPNLTLGLLVFNQAPYIKELLESVINQSDEHFALLIIDNGSQDNSAKEIQKFAAQPRIAHGAKFIVNTSNSGSAAGLRQLLEECDTRYLSVIHGDDILHEDYVSMVRKEIEIHPSIEAFNVALAAFSSDIDVKLVKSVYRPIWTKSHIFNRLLVSGLNPGVMPGSVLNKEFVLGKKLLNFDEKINGVEDTLLWMRIIRSGGHIQSVKRIAYNYRIHKSQFSFDDSRNSYYYGLARRQNILEAQNWLQRTLSSAEISYELQRFGVGSQYLEGLGVDLLNKRKSFRLFRPINSILRRIAIVINY
jgi:glycosyltransferase involved in cell wall biosynthesis